ncbi:MAG: hypothetical protein Q9170_004197 [Blastenia crenularia]
MSRDSTTTQSAFLSSINKPSSISVSTTQDPSYPTGLITDTSIPSSSNTILIDSSSIAVTTTTSAYFNSETSSVPTTTTSASSTAAAAAVPVSQPALTKPQIAGVAVGSVAAVGFVFGLLALIFCLRGKERKRRGSEASFGNDKIIVDQPRTPSPPLAAASQDVERGNQEVETSRSPDRYAQAFPPRRQSNRWSLWQKSTQPEDIAVAAAPCPSNPTHDHSPVTPMSVASYETTSRLLPDKPVYSLFPAPLRISSYNQEISPVDAPGPAAAGFIRPLPGLTPKSVPRGQGVVNTSQISLQLGQPTIRHVPSDPFLDSSSSSRPADPRQLQTLPAQRNRSNASRPVNIHYGQPTEPVEIHRKPVPARLPLDTVQMDPTISRVDWGADMPVQSPSLGTLVSSASQVQPNTRRSSSRRKFGRKRPQTFLSGSETSFEDADSDDEPSMPRTELSPLLESPPARRPHAASVRYPIIPTSAAESPSINRTVREVRREQVELNPASDRSKGKAKASPRTPPSIRDKALPNVPELPSGELRERQQAPYSNDDGVKAVKPGSAKYTVLVAPGLDGVENVGTPRSKSSAEWTPLGTPTRRGR